MQIGFVEEREAIAQSPQPSQRPRGESSQVQAIFDRRNARDRAARHHRSVLFQDVRRLVLSVVQSADIAGQGMMQEISGHIAANLDVVAAFAFIVIQIAEVRIAFNFRGRVDTGAIGEIQSAGC